MITITTPAAPAAHASLTASPADCRRPRNRRGKWLLLVSIVILLIAAAFACDSSVESFVVKHPNVQLDAIARIISRYCDWPYLLLCAVLTLAVSYWRGNRRWTRIALALLVSSAIAGALCTSIRSVTGRTRPEAKVAQGWYGMRHDSQWLVGKEAYNSFPSGHVGTAAGFAGILILGVRRSRIFAVLLGAAVAWSRMFMQFHHLSDVIVASVIGLSVAYYTWHVLMPKLGPALMRPSTRVTPNPSAAIPVDLLSQPADPGP